MSYKFAMPVGARVDINNRTFIYQGGSDFIGDDPPCIIECTLTDGQLQAHGFQDTSVVEIAQVDESLHRGVSVCKVCK